MVRCHSSDLKIDLKEIDLYLKRGGERGIRTPEAPWDSLVFETSAFYPFGHLSASVSVYAPLRGSTSHLGQNDVKRTERSKTKINSRRRGASAFHGTIDTPDGSFHVVGIGHLRVIVLKREGFWFARGLDIDYAAQGTTLSEVKKNFERGLEKTIDLHLNEFGNIEKLLTPMPLDARKRLIYSPSLRYEYSQVSTHRLSEKLKTLLNSEAITFIQPVAA
jgi:hypothetical protein